MALRPLTLCFIRQRYYAKAQAAFFPRSFRNRAAYGIRIHRLVAKSLAWPRAAGGWRGRRRGARATMAAGGKVQAVLGRRVNRWRRFSFGRVSTLGRIGRKRPGSEPQRYGRYGRTAPGRSRGRGFAAYGRLRFGFVRTGRGDDPAGRTICTSLSPGGTPTAGTGSSGDQRDNTLAQEPTLQGPLRRQGAKPGDVIIVTGSFGGSILGHQFDFEPRVREAPAAARRRHDLHGGIDVSDGLSLDLSRIGGGAAAAARGCGWTRCRLLRLLWNCARATGCYR